MTTKAYIKPAVLLLLFFCLMPSEVFSALKAAKPLEDLQNFTLIYTKLPTSERVREFYLGFSGFMSTNKIKSPVQNINLNYEGDRDSSFMSYRISHVAQSILVQKLSRTIIATDSEAHNLIADIDSLFPPDIPKVSVSLEGSPVKTNNNISTITTRIFFEENLSLGLHLFPKTKQIVVITDNSSYGKIEKEAAKKQLTKFSPKASIAYHSPDTSNFEAFVKTINGYPKNTIIILSSWHIDKHGNYFINNKLFPFLSQIDNYPVFASQNLMVGSGVIGGYTVSTWDIGYQTAQIVNDLQPGEVIHEVLECQQLIFDFAVMKRWDIGVNKVPKNSIVINRTGQLMDDYKREVFITILIFVALAISIAAFFISTLKSKKVTRENKRLSQELIQKNEFLNIAMDAAKAFSWSYNTFSGIFKYGESFYKNKIKNNLLTNTLESFIKLVHPNDRSKVREFHKFDPTSPDANFRIEFRISWDNGQTYEWWERRGLCHKIGTFTSENMIIYGMDFNITSFKLREQELNLAKVKAEEADKLKTIFLSNMSHEIRTPLNGVLGFASLLASSKYSEEAKEDFANQVLQNAETLNTIMNQVMDLSRLESKAMSLHFSSFNLTEQIKLTAERFKILTKPGVSIVTELPEQDMFAYSDPDRNQQILSNLLSNAIKYTNSGQISIGVKTEKDGYISVYVSDTGTGIRPDHFEHIFDRFYKADDFEPGAGLGLPICRALADALGSKIEAQSEYGKGSTFSFTVNTVPDIEHKFSDNMDIKQDNLKISKDEPDTIEPPDNQIKETILIAEDLDSNFLYLKIILSKKYDILWAKDGEATVKLFKEYNPDLILMDIKMPVMDGLEATRLIREISPTVPIIAQTANAFETDHQKAKEAGCDYILTKPIKVKQLVSVVDQFIAQSKQK